MARSRIQRLVPALAFAMAWGLVCPAKAAVVERCAWPPPGGPAVRPDSINVEASPLVADLDGDGHPEIVFVSFTNGRDDNLGRDGVLRILDGRDCSEIATVEDVGCVACFGSAACASLDVADGAGIFCPACTPAIADIDGDGFLEIVATTEDDATVGARRRLVVLDHRGNFVRCTEPTTIGTGPVAGVVLADLDADGTGEMMTRDVAWSATGALLWEYPISGIGATMAADLDGDGVLEVTTGQVAYRADGTEMWRSGALGGGSPAVADFDLDCRPDLIVTSRNNQTVNLVDPRTGAIRASAPIPAADCPDRSDGQGGPPTLGDVDGDCIPEIGVAGCRRYALYRYEAGPPEQLVLSWESPTDDATSRFTGSAIFDLEGDGTAEVLYNDHLHFRVYDALTGAVETELPNSTGTLMEFPVVADADADGHADVLIAANRYAFCCEAGVRVLTDDAVPWAPVRSLFNQHSYHVTNILDDGRLPRGEEPSWSRYNTFRVQGEPLREASGPGLVGVPADVSVECGPVPPPPPVSAVGGCGETPSVVLGERRVDGACPQSYELHRTWTATDRCGRTAAATQVVTVADTGSPVLRGVPADAVATCAPPPPPVVGASDDCDAAPVVSLAEVHVAGGCPLEYRLERTWTARDACDNVATATQVIDVVDDGPPSLVGVPPDAVATCEAPAAPAVLARDGCDPAPLVSLIEQRLDGACPHEFRVVRTWTARDACGHETTGTQVVTVVDDGPPRLVGVPADVVVDCGAVPPPAAVRAEDGCDPDPPVTYTEERLDGPCVSTYRLVRRWEVRDACGHVVTAQQVVDVVDRTPPRVVSAATRACLWPPNHWMACFGPDDFRVEVTDDCSSATWRFVGCESDQPENDLGDGNTAPDCVVGDDGSVCVRAERQGTDPEGRHYGLLVVAVDDCGNASAPVVVANVYVPHDQSPHEDCLKAEKGSDPFISAPPASASHRR